MIKKLAPYTKGYRLLMLFAIACSAGEAVLELTLPQVMSDIVDIGIANGDRGYILMAGLKMVIMALLALGCGVGAAALAAKASMGFGAALRKAEYEQVQRFSFANIERFSTASLVTRLTNDVASVQMTAFMGMRMLVRAPTMLVTALVMALIISTRLSQVFLVVIPLLIIAVVIVIKRVGPFFTSLQGGTDQLNLVVQEDLNAIRVVKSFVRESQEKEKFTQRSEKLRSMAERAFGFVVLFMPVMMVLMGGTITAVMWIGGHYVWEGTLLSGDLIAFFTYVSEILMSLMMVSVVLMMLHRPIWQVYRTPTPPVFEYFRGSISEIFVMSNLCPVSQITVCGVSVPSGRKSAMTSTYFLIRCSGINHQMLPCKYPCGCIVWSPFASQWERNRSLYITQRCTE